MRELQWTQLRSMGPEELAAIHPGLAYDRWAPVEAGTGKVADGLRDTWLGALERWSEPEGYGHSFQAWENSLASGKAALQEIELASRLLIGHGLPAPAEIGLSLHHTWGVPLIPGTALKGLLSHFLEAVYGPEQVTDHPMHPSLEGVARERAKFQGVLWKGSRPQHGPGVYQRELFGAPDALSDDDYAEHGGTGATRGRVQFHDAWFLPAARSQGLPATPYARDILTSHQSGYYRSGGGSLPNDYDEPNPVAFLTVRPGTRFLLAIDGDSKWAAFAMRHLIEALAEWGVGGKTTSGYGRMVPPPIVSGANESGERKSGE